MQPTVLPDTDYYIRLGLECDPFARDALPDFFFVGAQRRFLVQRAVHALYFSGATVLLLGADGIGKTRTLSEIEKELKDLADICRIEATVLMSATEIRALLTAVLGLPGAVAADNVELVHALEHLRPADGDPQPVLLAIDAAQLLSIETLTDCAALIAGAGGRLRLLLVGEADLATAWQQVQAGAVEILELTPLDRDETADYVRTKLQAAGYREEQPLSDTELDQLFAQSGGRFAAINALAPQFLQPPQQTSAVSRRIKALPLLHIGLIAALLAVIILLVLYRGSNSQSSKETQLTQSADTQTQQAADKKTPEQKAGAEQSSVALQLPAATAPAINSPSATLPAPAAVVAPPAEAPVPTPVPVAIENKPQAVERKSVVDKNKKETTNKKEVVERSATLSADERALLAFPSSNYVLQLMGAESKATVDKFASGAGKGLKLYYYRTQLRGKPWFIVVTGPYADKSATQAAQTKLPEAVRKQQPWARTLANVQADIRAHSGR